MIKTLIVWRAGCVSPKSIYDYFTGWKQDAEHKIIILLWRNKGMWHSGSAAALHAASPGFDPPLLQATFHWSRVRLTLGAKMKHS